MKVVFAGSPPFATPILAALVRSRHAVRGLVTPPDRPRGRGLRIERSPLAEICESAAIPVLYTANANDPTSIEGIRAMQPGALVVASFGQLLKDELLQLAPWGSFNVHGSLLPRHRGASPVAAAILAGDEETGVTVQKMVKRLDAGAIGAIERTEIRPRETAGELSDRLAHLGAGLLVSFLDRLEQGDVEFVQQDEENATYCGKLSKDSGQIDWRDSAATIERFVRAMTPWPGARAKVVAAHSAGGGDATIPMKVLESIVKEDSAPGGPPGTILKLPSEPRGSMPESLDVTTGRGVLRIVRLHPEGGKPQSAAEFLRGRRLVAGSAMRSLPADA